MSLLDRDKIIVPYIVTGLVCRVKDVKSLKSRYVVSVGSLVLIIANGRMLAISQFAAVLHDFLVCIAKTIILDC